VREQQHGTQALAELRGQLVGLIVEHALRLISEGVEKPRILTVILTEGPCLHDKGT
jgi:hypothetical protein